MMDLKRASQIAEVVNNASLPLQIMLYFNLRWAFLYFAVILHCVYNQFYTLEAIHKTLSVLAIIVSIPLEGCRLFCGYSGNLRNRTPDLVVFLILSTFIQLPIQIYFIANYDDFSAHLLFVVILIVQICFILIQVLAVVPQINKQSAMQIEQFKLEQLIRTNPISW